MAKTKVQKKGYTVTVKRVIYQYGTWDVESATAKDAEESVRRLLPTALFTENASWEDINDAIADAEDAGPMSIKIVGAELR